jgi:hypothetical protein
VTGNAGLKRRAIAAANTLLAMPSRDLIAAHFPNAKIADEFGEFETLLSTKKARRVLGYSATLDDSA